MSGLQGYYNTVNSFGSNLQNAQSFLSNYDDSYFTNTLSDFNEKVAKVREQGQSLVEAGAGAEGLYLGAKGIKASVKALRAKFKKNDGDEDGKGEGNPEEEGGDELQMDEMPDDLDTSAVDAPISDSAATTDTAATSGDTAATTTETATEVGAEGLDDATLQATQQVQDAISGADLSQPLASSQAAQTTSFGAPPAESSSGQQYFSTEPEDEFDAPSGLGGDLSAGQDATTASRLADNPSMLTGERAGPEVLGEFSGGGSSGVTADGADISIPKIQSGDQSAEVGTQSTNDGTQSTSLAEESGEASSQPTQAASTSSGAEGATDATTASDSSATATTETTNVAKGATETSAETSAETTGAETAGEVGGDVAADVGTDVAVDAGATALEVGLGVASVALEAVPIVGGLAAIGIGLFDLFHHSSKPKPPPPPQQTTTQKGEVTDPSFDTVTDTPAAASAF